MRQKPLREDMHRKLHARLRMDAELGKSLLSFSPEEV